MWAWAVQNRHALSILHRKQILCLYSPVQNRHTLLAFVSTGLAVSKITGHTSVFHTESRYWGRYETVTFGLHFTTQTRWTALFPFSLSPHPEAHVRYDLTSWPCTIWSGGLFEFWMYDINLRATHTTILSIRGVTIPIYLVSSATDSIRQRVVLFKPVQIPTSDLKSEFLCQLSYIAQNLQIPLNHLIHLGNLPRPRHHVSSILPQSKCSYRVPEAEAPSTES